MTTTSLIRDWLTAINGGDITFRDSRFCDQGLPVDAGAQSLLKQIVLSGWAKKTGDLIKLTDDGERELGDRR